MEDASDDADGRLLNLAISDPDAVAPVVEVASGVGLGVCFGGNFGGNFSSG